MDFVDKDKIEEKILTDTKVYFFLSILNKN